MNTPTDSVQIFAIMSGLVALFHDEYIYIPNLISYVYIIPHYGQPGSHRINHTRFFMRVLSQIFMTW